ncbi:MAG: glycosyltransferase family 2 protein [Hyphomonadaceae bacterium]
MTTPRERIIENAAARRAARAPSRLSILIPFHKHDPSALIAALARESGAFDVALIDDGSASFDLTHRLAQKLEMLAQPARLIVWEKNAGRAQARNRLIQAARATHVLFLDADTLPAAPGFIRAWLDLAARENPVAAFGGFSVEGVKTERQTRVHKALAERSDCRPAAARGPEHVTTCNLMVRREALAALPFDDRFSGWGWEDVDWALRAERFGPIRQIDNPVLHLGLDPVAALLRKCAEAGPNFARLLLKHPDAAARMPSARAARFMARIPRQGAMRPLLAALARSPAPILLRVFALKLYRTSIYAEHTA